MCAEQDWNRSSCCRLSRTIRSANFVERGRDQPLNVWRFCSLAVVTPCNFRQLLRYLTKRDFCDLFWHFVTFYIVSCLAHRTTCASQHQSRFSRLQNIALTSSVTDSKGLMPIAGYVTEELKTNGPLGKPVEPGDAERSHSRRDLPKLKTLTILELYSWTTKLTVSCLSPRWPCSCANQNWFICCQNIMFTSLVTDE